MHAPTRKAAAWSVHAYTALGLPLAYLSLEAIAAGDAPRFLLLSCLAALVDGTDGMLARAAKVKEVVPGFSGRRLDDIVDFLHFVCLPLVAVVGFGMLPPGTEAVVVLPLVASAYGFCQEHAKTEESFVGFPSYWNVLVLYCYVLGASQVTVLASLVALSIAVFVPIHYVYPSRTRLLKKPTYILGFLWTAMMFAMAIAPETSWARQVALLSLYYPAYYLALSAVHHTRVMRDDGLEAS